MNKFLISFLLITSNLTVLAVGDSLRTNLQLHGNIQLTNNGISPVPYFTLGRPALLTTLILQNNRFTFSPEINLDLEAKPWSFNTWLLYRAFQSGKFSFYVGSNFSFIFKKIIPQITSDELQLQRYQMTDFRFSYDLGKISNVQLIYWHTTTLDNVGLSKSDFLMLVAKIPKLLSGKIGSIGVKPSIFYIKNTAPFSGIIASNILTFYPKNSPFALTIQTVQPINVSPSGKFNWNLGLNLIF